MLLTSEIWQIIPTNIWQHSKLNELPKTLSYQGYKPHRGVWGGPKGLLKIEREHFFHLIELTVP